MSLSQEARSPEQGPLARTRLIAIVPNPGAGWQQAGGVVSAAKVLFDDRFQRRFDLRVVDSVMRPFPPPGWAERLVGATRRSAVVWQVCRQWSPEIALAFCSEGPSFFEKSAQLLVARRHGARTFLSPRSGFAAHWLRRSGAGRQLVRSLGERLDGLIVQSESWREVYAGFDFPWRKICGRPSSVDVVSWAAVADRRRKRAPRTRFRFLFLGWAIPAKGLPELLLAAERLANQGAAIELAIAGDGEVAAELRRRRSAGQLPDFVDLLGWVGGQARADELLRADALVLPSHGEGFPNVVLEAMACGLPVVATRVGATAEVVKDGVTGILVDVGDITALAQAMHRLVDDRAMAGEMGAVALDTAQREFDREKSITKLMNILAPARERDR